MDKRQKPVPEEEPVSKELAAWRLLVEEYRKKSSLITVVLHRVYKSDADTFTTRYDYPKAFEGEIPSCSRVYLRAIQPPQGVAMARYSTLNYKIADGNIRFFHNEYADSVAVDEYRFPGTSQSDFISRTVIRFGRTYNLDEIGEAVCRLLNLGDTVTDALQTYLVGLLDETTQQLTRRAYLLPRVILNIATAARRHQVDAIIGSNIAPCVGGLAGLLLDLYSDLDS